MKGFYDGRYSVGVTSEEAAQALRVDGADVDYIYPEEGTVVVVDGTAIRRGCVHEEAAGQILEFTISRDARDPGVRFKPRSVGGMWPRLEGLVPGKTSSYSAIKKTVLRERRSSDRVETGDGRRRIMKQTVKRFSLSFKNRVFFMCLLATLVPLLISSVVMVHIFTMSLNRQSEGTAKQQIAEISERFSRLLEDCENTCAELTADGSAAWNLIDNTTIEIQKGMYLSLYQAVQEIYGHAQCSVYDAGGRRVSPRILFRERGNFLFIGDF